MEKNALLQDVSADDFIEYFIYPLTEKSGDKLSELYAKILSFISQWMDEYFWHREKFNLRKITDPQSENDIPHLYGILYYGENIDDEWFLVYLMREISKAFDVAVRVVDSDGEFILIEAANYLDKSLNPDSSDRRVYFHRGVIRIVPMSSIPKIVDLKPVITFLNTSHEITRVERNIANCIDAKLRKFSDNFEELLHRSRVYLPIKVAALLDAKPSLISVAISSFCNRDAIDEKIYKKTQYFPPEDLVLRLVTFTKFSYAMVSQDKSLPARKVWPLPIPSHPQYKEHLLGYKITTGFDILASKCVTKSGSDLSLCKKWHQYLQVLKKKGYFKDFLEHSKGYVELEKKARTYFLDNVGLQEVTHEDIISILQTIKCDMDKMTREEASLPESDDEKWMDVSEDEFNKMLEERFGLKGIDAAKSPAALSGAIDQFLNQVSGIEGIELENDKIASERNEMDSEDDTNRKISFDSDEFMTQVQQMLKKVSVENEDESGVSDSDDDDDDDDDDDSLSNDEENAPEDADMKIYMDLMDKEVAEALLSKDIVEKSDETVEPQSITNDAMDNIIKSYEEQCGGSGPAGNLIHSLGLKLGPKKET